MKDKRKNVEKMSPEEILEEKRRCEFGIDGMSGEEYFFFNYCWIDGKPQEYSPEALQKYRAHVESLRYMQKAKLRRHGPNPSYNDIQKYIKKYPLNPSESFPIIYDELDPRLMSESQKENLKKAFKDAIPKFDNKSSVGIPIIVGAGSEGKGSLLYKELWENHMNDNKSSIYQDADFNSWLNQTKGKLLKNTCPDCKEDLYGGVLEQFKHRSKCDKIPKYEGMTLESLTKSIEEVLSSRTKNKDKGFLVTGYCKTVGKLIQFDVIEGTPCSDETCGLCGGFVKAMKSQNETAKDLLKLTGTSKTKLNFKQPNKKYHK